MSTEPMTKATGGCLCGAVRYEVRGELRPVVYCHCAQCRKTSGNYVAATACDADDLIMLADTALQWYASSPQAERGFCRDCGSNLFWRATDRKQVSIMAGAIDTPTGLKGIAHIFVGNASDYLTIGDGLPQHQRRGPVELTVDTE